MRNLLLVIWLIGLFGCNQHSLEKEQKKLDWQGHRGARGLVPENTIQGFLKALEFPVTTLELDCVISKDSQVVVSHEPWMSAAICSWPDGNPITKSDEESLYLFQMDYNEIKQFDCGQRGNENFPGQIPQKSYKPLLSEVFDAVKVYCTEQKKEIPNFNIEIKSNPEWDEIRTPNPTTFATLLINVIREAELQGKSCIQSFDIRALQAVHQIDSTLVTAFLIANTKNVNDNLKSLGYTPEIYSPNFRLVTANVVTEVHEKGLKIIPWTVNELKAMKSLELMGVDGIITDYPNLILEFNSK